MLYAVQQLFCAVLTAFLQIFFLLRLDYGVKGYLWGVILGDTATFLLLLACRLPRLWQEGRGTRALCRKMLRYSAPLIPTALLWWVISISDRYILLYFWSEAETGLYAAAARLPTLLSFAVSVFMEAWHYAALRTEEGERAVLFGRIYALLLPALFFLSGALILADTYLVRLFLSAEYAGAAALIPLLTLGVLCGGISNFLDSIYTLRLSSFSSLLTSLAAAVCNLLLNFFLIPRYAAMGAALSTAISFALLFLLRLWHTRRFLTFARLEPYVLTSLSLLFAAALLYGVGKRGISTALIIVSLAVLWRISVQALVFLWHRSRILLKSLKKTKKYRKKI